MARCIEAASDDHDEYKDEVLYDCFVDENRGEITGKRTRVAVVENLKKIGFVFGLDQSLQFTFEDIYQSWIGEFYSMVCQQFYLKTFS